MCGCTVEFISHGPSMVLHLYTGIFVADEMSMEVLLVSIQQKWAVRAGGGHWLCSLMKQSKSMAVWNSNMQLAKRTFNEHSMCRNFNVYRYPHAQIGIYITAKKQKCQTVIPQNMLQVSPLKAVGMETQSWTYRQPVLVTPLHSGKSCLYLLLYIYAHWCFVVSDKAT